MSRSEAVPYDKHRVRVLVILAQEIGVVASDECQVQRRAPMLAEELRVFTFEPYAIAVLPDRHFESNVAIRIDGVTAASQYCFRKTAVRCEFHGSSAATGDRLSCVAAQEEP